MALTRQKVRNLPETGKDALKGGYVLKDLGEKADVILMASGSEVALIYDAAESIHEKGYGVRVVSMPSLDVFDKQSSSYRESVLPASIRTRLSIEAGATQSWYKYVGLDGKAIGIDSFGASAPAGELFDKFGFTVGKIVDEAMSLLDA